MQYVYVLNKHGEPLMPCSPRKARLLLKQKKVYVVKRTPFTIKLLYGSTGYKQPITLGIDAGSKHIGISATTEKYELYCEEATPRNDVVDLLSARRAFRRSRRNRKTRYRAPRFDNRVHSKHNDAHKSEDEYLPASYPTEDMAYMAAELNAFAAAQELNLSNRENNGSAESVFFAVDEDPDDFDFVVRCWDGDDYQIESRYKVIKEEEE